MKNKKTGKRVKENNFEVFDVIATLNTGEKIKVKMMMDKNMTLSDLEDLLNKNNKT